jgi:hypothetical protein
MLATRPAIGENTEGLLGKNAGSPHPDMRITSYPTLHLTLDIFMRHYLVNAKTAGAFTTIALLAFAVFQAISVAGLRQAAMDGFNGSLTGEQLISLQLSTLLTGVSFTIGCFAVAIAAFTYFATRNRSDRTAIANVPVS